MAGYAEIAEDYRSKIQRGELSPGDRMPTLREVMEAWDVSMATASRAYKELQAQGLTTASSGAGTVVARAGSPTISARVQAHAATGRALDADESSAILEVGTVGADETVASRLGVAPGTPVHVRRRVVSRGGVPVHLSASYYLPFVIEATPELTELVSTGGSRELAAERLGSPQSRVLEEVTSRLATDPEKDSLGLTGASVIVTQVVRTVYLADGRIVEVAVRVVGGTTVLRWASNL
ncbi:GntR family transcriptional regulator [Streptomyces sp. or20]|uniref:GntR family transcriptional regulator n=1 Tax=Streptomyces sp. or20 TaxID=1828016 RepID=UPI000BF1605F|nr:GntR family transcriptional regulator [Streptomyces sp. or20]